MPTGRSYYIALCLSITIQPPVRGHCRRGLRGLSICRAEEPFDVTQALDYHPAPGERPLSTGFTGSFHFSVVLRSPSTLLRVNSETKHLVGRGLHLRICFDGVSRPAPPGPSPAAQGDNERTLLGLYGSLCGIRLLSRINDAERTTLLILSDKPIRGTMPTLCNLILSDFLRSDRIPKSEREYHG